MTNGMNRRTLLRVGTALGVGGIVGVPELTGEALAATLTAGRKPRIPSRAYFGVFQPGTVPGISAPEGLEDRLGRRVAINHHFRQPPDGPWAPLRDRMLRDKAAGRIPMLSYAAGEKPGFTDHDQAARARLREIARGERDAQIDGQAAALAALRTPVFLRFTWEFDLRYLGEAGAAMHRAAWRHVWTRFQAKKATNVAFVWCPSWLAFANGSAATYYPGEKYVDWIGADGYARTPDYRSFSALFTRANTFAVRRHKPFMVCETGVHRLTAEESTVDGTTAQSRWLDGLRANLNAGRFENLRALLYFHVDGDDHPLPNQWRVTAPLDGPALASFAKLAWNPRLGATR